MLTNYPLHWTSFRKKKAFTVNDIREKNESLQKKKIQLFISWMAQCKTAVTPSLTHWGYCSLALSYRYVFVKGALPSAWNCGPWPHRSMLAFGDRVLITRYRVSWESCIRDNRTSACLVTSLKVCNVILKTSVQNVALISFDNIYFHGYCWLCLPNTIYIRNEWHIWDLTIWARSYSVSVG